MIIKSYDKSKEDKLLDFIIAHPWKPLWSVPQIKEFINLYISSPELLFDFHDQDERVAVAILIDKITNRGNNACLEIVALNQNNDIFQLYAHIIQCAKQYLPLMLMGIEISIEATQKTLINLVVEKGFSLYYEVHEMHSTFRAPLANPCAEISPILKQDLSTCYQVMCEAFKDNPEMAIPDYEDWCMAKASDSVATWVYKESDRIIGFINVDLHDVKNEAEIRTIGVMPSHRKQGIGKKLLSQALAYLQTQGMLSCRLTVVTHNESALRLYQELGFEVFNHFKVYCWKRPSMQLQV